MADRKWHPCIVLAEKVLFRFAFAVCVLFAVVLWFLALAGASIPFRSDGHLPVGVFITLLFLGLFGIGAASYVVFQSLTRADYVLTESERWLAERRNAGNPWIKRRKVITRWAVWIPTVSVVLACIFLDQTRAIGSHLFQPAAGRIIGYRVSIPLRWMVWFNAPELGRDDVWSFVTATRSTGTVRAARDYYRGRVPHFHMSEMAFYGARGAQLETNRHSPFGPDRMTFSYKSRFAGGDLVCSQYLPRHEHEADAREIACWTPKGDFSCSFSGYESDVSDFYQTLAAITVR